MFEDFYKKYKEDIKNCFKDLKDKDKRIKQIPNLLTASRLLAPLFIVPAAFSGNIPLAILFTCLFEFTDALDGFAARKLNAVSEFGKDLDPIVDKIFAAGLMIPLIIKFPAVTACIFNEALIGKKNIESKKKGNVPRTTLLGKFKTLLLSISLLIAYIAVTTNSIPALLINCVFVLTASIEYITAKQYEQIDKEKDLEKTYHKIEKTVEEEKVKQSKKEIIKKYSRSNEISDLKKLKEELLSSKNKTEEKNKTFKK